MSDTQRNLVSHPAAVALADAPLGEFYLLAIGIDHYAHWPPLQTAARGAEALSEALARDYGFARIVCLLNASATRAGIVAALRRLAQDLTSNDSLMVYFGGHGHLDEITGAGAWIPADGQRPTGADDHSAAASWLENLTVKTLLRACKARHILLVSDSCFAGDFLRAYREAPPVITDAYVRRSFARTSRQALTSGALEPVSDQGVDGHSVFTGFLLRALTENREPWLLPGQLHERVRSGVAQNAPQQPLLGTLHDTGGEVGGEFVLFRRGTATVEEAIAQRKARLTALERAEADASAARDEQQRELAAREAEAAELDRQIAALQERMGGAAAAAGGGTLDDLLALVEQRESEGARMDELRRKAEEDRKQREAEIARLREEERERPRRQFAADWAKYQRIVSSAATTPELRQQAWRRLCAAWQVPASEAPGELEWSETTASVVIRLTPDTATNDRPFENSLGMKFVPAPVSCDGKRTVLCSIWPTRVKDYAAYAAANSGVDTSWKNPGFTQESDHPVVNVSWEDAQKFCAWLTAKERAEGRVGSHQEYRLPTDKEWSWAVGIGEAEEAAGKNRRPMEKDGKIEAGTHPWAFPWGRDWPPPRGAGNYAPTLGVDDFAFTSPVGSFTANSGGLHDVGGNVWEWCETWYDHEQKWRVLRGGSWLNYVPRDLLSSCRTSARPTFAAMASGFGWCWCRRASVVPVPYPLSFGLFALFLYRGAVEKSWRISARWFGACLCPRLAHKTAVGRRNDD